VGTANFGVTATASNSCTGSRSYSITVNCPTITVSPVSLPNGTIGTAYSQTVSANGVAGSFTFNVTSGALPAGVTLNSSGQLSGMPTVSGSFNFTITATNSTCTGNRAYTLTINACTATPQGLISSWRAEGNANDSTGSNNGVVQGSVSFVTGQIGQAFSFAGGGYVDVPDSTTLEPANVTAEAWVRHAGSPGYYKYIVSKGARDDYASSYGIYTLDGGLNFYVFDGNLSFYNSPSMGPSVWDGQWHHVVGTFDGARVRLYVDGQQVGNGNPVPPGFTIGYNLPTTDTLNIGSARGGSFYHFIGDIDEVKIYNRALSHNEVQGNFGNCGPLPSPSPTPTPNTLPGNNVTAQSQSGDALATFAQVTDAGNTTFTPISPPSSAGTPPPNYIILGNAPAYAITTIASYTAPVTVCFTVSSINDPAEFARVRILHGENGPLVDRTILAPDSPAPDFATRKVCARVNSLSPFVTALAPAATPTPTPTPPVVQFSTASYNKSESGPSTNITVTRTGDTSGTSTVEFRTGNNSYVPCNTVNGVTTQNCDFIISSGTLTFAPGQTSRSFPLIIIDDLYVEGDETLSLSLSNPAGAVLGSLTSATLTIADNDSVTPTTNPLDEARYFVREHYYDFLGRLPDDGGLDYWTNEITQCGANTACINDRRAGVSNAFFYEQEYQQTASFVFLLYRASFGNDQPFPNPDFFDSNLSAALHAEAKKLPRNLSFARDRVQVVGGSGLAQSQLALANAFVLRPEFTTRYPASLTTASQFVDAVLTTIRTDSGAELITQRDTLIGHFNTGGRGLVMFHLANDYWNGCNRLPGSPPAPCVPVGYGDAVDNRAFIDAEYNRSFVYSQYSGYLRRDGDIGGFLFWLNQVSTAPPRNVPKQRAMVCSFITSTEYQQRFSPIVSHSNAECGP
jgi:hypothetical protein